MSPQTHLKRSVPCSVWLLPLLKLFPALQDSYRKVDVISKAEFDSQRGTEEEADSDLVFGPLDQEDMLAAPPTTITTLQPHDGPTPKSEQEQQRGRGKERDEGKPRSSLAAGSPSPHSRQRRKKDRSRFYPVLNKQQQSPSNVRIDFVCEPFPSFLAVLCLWTS